MNGRNLRLATRRFEPPRWTGSLAVFRKTASRRSGYDRQAVALAAGRANCCSRRAASNPDQFGFFAAAPAKLDRGDSEFYICHMGRFRVCKDGFEPWGE